MSWNLGAWADDLQAEDSLLRYFDMIARNNE